MGPAHSNNCGQWYVLANSCLFIHSVLEVCSSFSLSLDFPWGAQEIRSCSSRLGSLGGCVSHNPPAAANTEIVYSSPLLFSEQKSNTIQRFSSGTSGLRKIRREYLLFLPRPSILPSFAQDEPFITVRHTLLSFYHSYHPQYS